MVVQELLTVATEGRGTYEITDRIQEVVRNAGCRVGTCHVFQHHTSASLIVTENADPTVRRDLETIAERLAPDGDPAYRHDLEGPDDMAAHIRSVLTSTEVTLPVSEGRCVLGTWQGVYLWEHRYAGFRRRVTVTVQGE
ncbi:secondary thiamine-phosphate synthase [Thiohalorhabdus denitrificans]|uniref:Secondary thiamine-phosphate synthase enzyme n=1 Tax=Thiohalorhabdus denitrificans TaxID=381306 RepID=A0A0N8PMU3_9GAMM|nr:secondary thiamine-phosphate synthase enzyme YjbQ [Thiohalorhabdus denitrificans]KPV39685.1 secondary thiamine-phosphate synthase [Thiohalorhabdus denitrificans]SCX94022.1 secondary thiamine-phosphate synthase enzyme [Thiohalorhabdus denitrificans]